MSFFAELKRRNVFRVAIAYVVASWLLLQVVDVVVPIIEAPDWVSKAILLMIVVGFPIVLIVAWAFELTPEGLKFERDVDRSKSVTPQTGRKIDFTIIAVLAIAVAWFALDKFIWSATSEEAVVEQKRSIAVLPFINMSGDPEQEFFSDGISEEILNKLVRADGISVASRTSSFGYRNHEQGIPQIAEALGVLFVLEGSVRKAGDRLRITAQLIDAGNDRHLWSETYDRDLFDVFEVQGDIATSITAAIHSELGIEGDSNIDVKTLTANMTAYDLYLKGSQSLNSRDVAEDVIDAIYWLEQAVELDPEFSAAWEMLAAAYAVAPYWRITDRSLEEYIQLSNATADKALALDPDLAYAVGIKGANLTATPPYDIEGAISLMQLALEKDPHNTTLHHWLGQQFQSAGFLVEGIRHQRRCLEIDPKYTNCGYFLWSGLHSLGKHEEARSILRQFFYELGGWTEFDAPFVAGLVLDDEIIGALIAANLIEPLSGAPLHEFVRALENPDADHSEGLQKFDDWAADNNVDLTQHPAILAALGAYDRVETETTADAFYWHPMYRHYRHSKEFKEMMRSFAFDTYWAANGYPPQCRPIGNDDFECD